MAKKKEEAGQTNEKEPIKVKVYQVLQTFRDKYTFDTFEIGDSYEGDPKRIKELHSLGFLDNEEKGSNDNEGK